MAKREQTESTDKKRAETPAVDYLEILGQCEKVAKVQSLALSDEDRLDTGLLCLNGILGGGITAGMYTFFGPEQSAKTTGAITLAGASVNQDVGLRMLWDAENSTGSSTDYVENIFKMQRVKADVETLFGVKKDGKYIIKPLVYYRDEGEAETFFNFMSALLRRLPLKRFEDKQWWLIYPKDKEHLARFGDQMDQRMSKLNDAIYLPAKSGALQAIVIIDSYPGLVPESLDDDDPNNSIAQAARELSKGITRIKGKLRSRRVALVGINQLRTNPMARFSNPEYEPGGGAIKFFSDVRLRFFPRALSSVPFHPKGEGQFEKEPGINGGTDTYRYINVRAIKNKLSLPNRETWLRIWVEDQHGQAQGYDPVWDVFYALHLSGQVEGKRSALRLKPHGRDPFKKTLTWLQFKQAVIGSKEQKQEVFKYLGMSKVVDLRNFLLGQMKKGVYEGLYVEAQKINKKAEANDE